MPAARIEAHVLDVGTAFHCVSSEVTVTHDWGTISPGVVRKTRNIITECKEANL